MEHETQIIGLAVTQDGTKIISSYHSGVIKVWDVKSHELLEEWTQLEYFPKIAISPDDRLIAVGTWTVTIYTMERRQVNHSIKVGNLVWSMCFSPDGKKLACGTDNDIHVYDIDSGTLILGPLRGKNRRIRCMLWSHDGSRLFYGSNNKAIRCWNPDTGEEIGHAWIGHTHYVRSLSLSPDGSILASASLDHTVRFWNAATGNPIGQHLQHGEEVEAVRFAPSGESVASAGWDGNIYLWKAPWLNSITHQVITHFRCVLTPALILCHFSHLGLPLTYVTTIFVYTFLLVFPSTPLYPLILLVKN